MWMKSTERDWKLHVHFIDALRSLVEILHSFYVNVINALTPIPFLVSAPEAILLIQSA